MNEGPYVSWSVVLVVTGPQTTEPDVGDLELGFAEATVSIALHENEVAPNEGRQAVGGGVLSTPEGTLWVGDADMEVVIPAHKGMTHFLVSVEDPGDFSPDIVRVDLWPSLRS